MGFEASTTEIYDAYLEIMRTKRRGDPRLPEQLKQRFRIEGWEWSRLKVVYETALSGDADAARLLEEVDAGSRTLSEAYGALATKRADAAANEEGAPSPVRLRVVQDGTDFVLGWAEKISESLRRGARIEAPASMSDADVRSLIKDVYRASKCLREIHAQLSQSQNGR